MIIRDNGTDLLLINQADHAALAADLGAAWGNQTFKKPALEDAVLLATRRHDDGWIEADDSMLFDPELRRPLFFPHISVERHIPLYRKGVLSIAKEDRYAGLLAGMHWTGQYRGRWGRQLTLYDLKGETQQASVLRDEVILEEEARWAKVKQELLTELDRRSSWEAQLWFAFELLQVWDLLSLFVCIAPYDLGPDRLDVIHDEPVQFSLTNVQKPASQYNLSSPVSLTEPLRNLAVQFEAPGVVSVDPYPFADPELTVSISGTVIESRAYANAAETVEAREVGEVRQRVCTFVPKRC